MSNTITCTVCPNNCIIEEGQRGLCKIRGNVDGRNVDLNYGVITSMALDPIEKKPLMFFYPGSNILSIGSFGCNLNCSFCQNHSISMSDGSDLQTARLSPEEVVQKAVELLPYNNIGIAFTYNEPTVGYEYILDTEKLAKEKGLKTVVVTNGCINPKIFEKIAENTDAFNIDLKGLEIYPSVRGDLDTVLKNIETAVKAGSHVEVTLLTIPGINDSKEEAEKIAKLLSEIDPNIVLHLTRFFPQYKMTDRPPTPVETLRRNQKAALRYLPNVILGNV